MNCAVTLFMNDELEMDASGCWVNKNARVMSETPLSSSSEDYSRLACSLDEKYSVDDEKRDMVFIIG